VCAAVIIKFCAHSVLGIACNSVGLSISCSLRSMSQPKRPAVKATVKRDLISEAGGKCANPGCANRLIEIHHIHEWHIVKQHDPDHMIAICPSCHDSVTRGDLRISDETAYEWKRLERAKPSAVRHLYVEPGGRPSIRAGTLTLVSSDSGSLVVFAPNEGNSISFSVRGNELMFLNAKVTTPDGIPVATVVDGYLEPHMPGLEVVQRTGKIEIKSSLRSPHITASLKTFLEEKEVDPDIPWLSLEVIAPNTVRLKGMWITGETGIAIDDERLVVMVDGEGVAMVGDPGGKSRIEVMGDPSDAFLKLKGRDRPPIGESAFGRAAEVRWPKQRCAFDDRKTGHRK
jgi:hypothetical protein